MLDIENNGVLYDTKSKKLVSLAGKDINVLKQNTITYDILRKHNISNDMNNLQLKFDALASHDITYVGIIQTARASGFKKFPIPYILTNCHNSLCAVGGTINEDDHMFGLSAVKKYGGIYVPPHLGVIHQYIRETIAGCGKMILGSDSHTRYGALGTMAMGEGGGELVKQILEQTYDIKYPSIIAIELIGKPKKGIGPQDIALTLIGQTFSSGILKNKVVEFIGDGLSNLSVEFRNGIDVMTTETTCLTSIWRTDDQVKDYLINHGREHDYVKLEPKEEAYYDGYIKFDLSKVESMIAMPFHPSYVYSIKELNANTVKIVDEIEERALKQGIKIDLKSKIINGKLRADQGIIGGCAGGTYDNIVDSADILKTADVHSEFTLNIYPSSQATYINLSKNNTTTQLMSSGAIVRSSFCGPCFGAGDTPANNQFSVRHNTRNFPCREGSKPSEGQISSVALMDSRSISATAINGGFLTPATDLDLTYTKPKYDFDDSIYRNKVFNYDNSHDVNDEVNLIEGPNIIPWPSMPALGNSLLLKVVAFIEDPVTTTDELIPSGEASSFRSNPYKLSEFTLSRRVPAYVNKAKQIREYVQQNDDGHNVFETIDELKRVKDIIQDHGGFDHNVSISTTIYAIKPGDGSAREQAASCQKILGGVANIAQEYATKRYRSNLINWGIIPFIIKGKPNFADDDYIYINDIKKALVENHKEVKALIIKNNNTVEDLTLSIDDLNEIERDVLLDGCLINFYKRLNGVK